MQLNQVLVIHKHTAYQIHKKGLRLPTFKQIALSDKKRAKRLVAYHKEHIKTLQIVQKTLKKFKIKFKIQDRNAIKSINNFDLVITVGGDGTVLRTSHLISKIPMLAVNSHPEVSTGFFCAANRNNFQNILQNILKDKLKTKKIQRLQVTINGKKMKKLSLNEILFASSFVADTSKYIIQINKTKEEQRSSGMWISTAAGSTAVIKSAGGKRLPLFSKKIQYFVREPYIWKKKYKLQKGVIGSQKKIKIISEISNGRIYIDGPKISYNCPIGTEVIVKASNKPLNLFI